MPSVASVSTIVAGDVPEPDQGAQRGEHPDHRRRGHANDQALPRQDHAAAEKADAAHDLGQHPRRVGLREPIDAPSVTKIARAQADQDAGPDAGGLAAELALDADQPPHKTAVPRCSQKTRLSGSSALEARLIGSVSMGHAPVYSGGRRKPERVTTVALRRAMTPSRAEQRQLVLGKPLGHPANGRRPPRLGRPPAAATSCRRA